MDLNQAEQAQRALSAVRIVSFVRRNGQPLFIGLGDTTVHLYTPLASQVHDAAAYLENHRHSVTSGLNQNEFEQLNRRLQRATFGALNKAIGFGVALVIALIVLVLLIGSSMTAS
ncbi:hypothetical protein [Arenicella chitinivorans]|uniref:hypothetical protein n=1 Tax=Arenicella chitinivorans TaxID=1329800 RepID=UPI001E3BF079|nr:hypothetical protein [Arenicella chitinivorans]